MTDTFEQNVIPATITYEDVRAVSLSLEQYTKAPLLDGLWRRPELSLPDSQRGDGGRIGWIGFSHPGPLRNGLLIGRLWARLRGSFVGYRPITGSG